MATILQILNSDPNLSLFNNGVKTTELANKLNEFGPFTILGPTNLALRGMSSLTYEQLMAPENNSKLLEILSGYILVGKRMFDDFRNNQKLVTLNGHQVTVTIMNDETYLNGSKILARNRQGSNGVVHLLNKTYSLNATDQVLAT